MDIRDRFKVRDKKMQQFLFVGMDSSYGFGILGSHDSGLVVCETAVYRSYNTDSIWNRRQTLGINCRSYGSFEYVFKNKGLLLQ